ncbi:hypothetical protein BH09PLA1_BH09PLA1_27070 [soil metagenome]
MPRIVAYEQVLARLNAQGMKCLYFNGGAFGFETSADVLACGWIGPADASIRDEVMSLTRSVSPPYAQNLSQMLHRAWLEFLPGEIWVMPASHWAYELDFGNAGWLHDALREIGVDAADLQSRTNAAAIEFALSEASLARTFIGQLLERLSDSDFVIAFPGRATLCSVHHHQQLWWQTTDASLAGQLADVAV